MSIYQLVYLLGDLSKVLILWEGHKNLKEISHLILPSFMFSLKYKNIIVGKIQPLCKDDLMWKTMYKVCYLCMYIVDIPSKLYYPKATFLYSVEQHSSVV